MCFYYIEFPIGGLEYMSIHVNFNRCIDVSLLGGALKNTPRLPGNPGWRRGGVAPKPVPGCSVQCEDRKWHIVTTSWIHRIQVEGSCWPRPFCLFPCLSAIQGGSSPFGSPGRRTHLSGIYPLLRLDHIWGCGRQQEADNWSYMQFSIVNPWVQCLKILFIFIRFFNKCYTMAACILSLPSPSCF